MSDGNPPGGGAVVRTADVWVTCAWVGDELDLWEARLDAPGLRVDPSEAGRVNGLLRLLRGLIAEQEVAPSHTTALGRLYEDPTGGRSALSELRALEERASRVAERITGRPEPDHVPSTPAAAMEVVSVTAGGPLEAGDAEGAPGVVEEVVATPTTSRDIRWRNFTEAMTVVGVLLVVLAAYLMWGSGLSQARSQRQLDRTFDDELRAAAAGFLSQGQVEQASGILDPLGDAGGETDGDEAQAEPVAEPPGPGDPVAILSIPTVGVRSLVVEGTTPSELTKGPGHLRGTPLPGQPGNAVLFGKRTTYGGPFERLDALEPGDFIDATTVQGSFRYIIETVEIVTPGETDPITPTFSNRLTLVTSDQTLRADGRLVVIGRLIGSAVAPLDGAEPGTGTTFVVEPDELGTGRQQTDYLVVMLWTLLLAAGYLGARWLYANWMPRSSWLVSAPVLLLVAFAWLDSVARLFPSFL